MKKLLLMDGSNMMFRAYYATAYSGQMMKNSKGEYTNAVYGLINMLNLTLKSDFTHALVAFDKGKATFRHKAYEDYKAKRTPMPDEFRSQLEWIKQVPEKLGMMVYETESLEADDIIGSLAHQYYDEFDEIEIVSNDKDLFQLLNHKVTLRMSKRGLEPDQIYTEETLKQDLNLKPHQIPDLKGLMGDASDNLPGVPGVGEKTALKLLNEFGSIETMLKNVNELKGKLKEKIEKNGQDAIKWRDLAVVKTDADLDISLQDLSYDGYDEDELINFYERFEFHSLIKRLNKQKKASKTTKDDTVDVIDSDDALKPYLVDDMTIVLERDAENYHFANPLGFALVTENKQGFIPFDVAQASQAFNDFLADEEKRKNTFDLKALTVMLHRFDMTLTGVVFDFLLAAYVLNPTYTKDDFKVIASHFDYDDVPYLDDVYGKGAKHKTPEASVYQAYAVKKALAIKSLKNELLDQLSEQDQTSLFNDVEMPLAVILANMEIQGISIDIDTLEAFGGKLDEEIESLEKSIYEHAGETFNIGSPKQLGSVLFETLDLPVIKKTKTGYSTSVDVLKRLQGKHPIIDDIMRYRTLTKLKNAYVNGLKDAVHDDGKIHTVYKQAYTQTGRLSSIEPNLQTIPIRTEIGRDLRKVFIPSDQDRLLAADYSQIELRLLAHLAEEKTLIKAFKDNQDIHAITGQEILGKKEISDQERRIAKAVNFGIIYGQSPWGLSEELDIPQKEAKRFIDAYYQKFSGISTYMDGVVKQAKERGYAETLFMRRRYIPELNSKIYAQREMGKRTAMNAPLQGSAADIIKIAMVKIDAAMRKQALKSTMILQIHDELVFDVHPDELDTLKILVKDTMEACVELKVPLTISIASGANLDEAK